jgi:hypothetical protein
MKLGFNTSGNKTNGRTTRTILLGKLRNTIASTSIKIKFCNSHSSDLDITQGSSGSNQSRVGFDSALFF